MLSDDACKDLWERLGLSAPAQAVIEAIRSAPPTRRVRGAVGNVTVRYPSRKMGVTIQAESHRHELAGIYEYEHDPRVLEFYDQPPPITLTYHTAAGRPLRVRHTPDYFVIRAAGVGWEEWKPEAALVQLAARMPHRYKRSEEGPWRCPPGEQAAEPFGFSYRVRSSAEIDWVLQRNLLFLEDYLHAAGPRVAEGAAAMVLGLVAQQPGITLDALLAQLVDARSDDVYALIATEQLYVDLHAAALAEPDRVRVYRDAGIAAAFATPLLPLGSRVPATAAVPAGEGLSDLARDRLACASPDDYREANRRYALISGSSASSPATPARTLRHWRRQYRRAEQLDGCGYVGLLPGRGRSGNRTRKLPAATLELMEHFLATAYETLAQKPRFAVYAALVRACEHAGTQPPSYKTFALAANRRPREEQVRRRQGPRAAAQVAPFYWELTPTTPQHGDRPFEIGHLDHTELDVELVCSRTGRPLGRPWATFLSDASSRRLLAVVLGFDPPSYRACLLALRTCVQRHQRLPQVLVVDGGAEFGSVYFETLLARYACAKKTRPAARPRFGAVCERLFGTTNTRFVHTLLGNTQVLRQPRQVTKGVDPKAQACWTLGALAARLNEWAYAVYDTLEHPALGQSPREAFAAGLRRGGERPQRHIADDETFRLLSLPTTSKGTAKVQARSGVKIHYLSYWSDAFLDPAVEGRQVPVRYDPFDAGVAYAYVQGRWVRCLAEHHAVFAGRTEREIQLASAELRRRHQRHGQQLPLTARKLADFLASVEAEEVLLEQRLRDTEARATLRPSPDPVLAPVALVPPPDDGVLGTPAPVLVIYGAY